jgi:hypothetical protein
MTSCHPIRRIVSPAQDVPGVLRRSPPPCSNNRLTDSQTLSENHPLSLKKISIEENGVVTVISFASENQFFKGKTESFPLLRFFLELAQHIPPKGCQYIRRYSLYASRSKGKWPDKPHVIRLAPAGWKKQQQQADQDVQPYDAEATCSVSDKESRSTWARLIAQV